MRNNTETKVVTKLDKKSIRKKIVALRAAASMVELANKNNLINQTLISLLNEEVKTIHSFIPMESEIDVTPFLRTALDQNKHVYSPESVRPRAMINRRLHSLEDLLVGIFGTSHPNSDEVFEGDYDLIVVPGLAFDVSGGRIGYGAGYYDNFLKDQGKAVKVGVAFDFQVLQEIPQEDHDIPVNGLIYF